MNAMNVNWSYTNETMEYKTADNLRNQLEQPSSVFTHKRDQYDSLLTIRGHGVYSRIISHIISHIISRIIVNRNDWLRKQKHSKGRSAANLKLKEYNNGLLNFNWSIHGDACLTSKLPFWTAKCNAVLPSLSPAFM